MDPIKTLSPVDQALVLLVDTMKEGKDFVLEQAPDVVQQLITYHTFREAVYLALGLALVVPTVKMWKKAKKLWVDENGLDDGPAPSLAYFFAGLLSIVTFITTFDALLSLIKITLAPKVWLIEYAARLVASA